MLDAAGASYTVRRYLEEPPTKAELVALLDRLELRAWEITRTGEPIAKELGIKNWPREESAHDRWVTALVEHPALIQRPIITADDGAAVIGRSEGAVRSVLP
jgi:arsenate reductase